jgi:CubicO group peptidase (beta-lactamase class C family)
MVDRDTAQLDGDRLSLLPAAIRKDVDGERIDGAVVLVAHRGEVVLHEAIGYADRAAGTPLRTDSVFWAASLVKHLTNTMLLRCVDRGDIALTSQIREVVPEYATKGKDSTTVADLLLQRAGLPFAPNLPLEVLGDIRALTAAVSGMLPENEPGAAISYAATVAQSVMAEIVVRLDGQGRDYREILAEQLLDPLKMVDTALSSRESLSSRRVPVVVRDHRPGLLDAAVLELLGNSTDEDFVVPAGVGLTTTGDYFRFAELFRREGELDGTRLLSPALVRYSIRAATGDDPNNLWTYTKHSRGWRPFPANLSLGFYVRGSGIFPHAFGQLASPTTYGGIGAGSNAFWVDPERDLTYVFLSTGLLEESRSWERHQRLSDLVHSAYID